MGQVFKDLHGREPRVKVLFDDARMLFPCFTSAEMLVDEDGDEHRWSPGTTPLPQRTHGEQYPICLKKHLLVSKIFQGNTLTTSSPT